MTNVAALARWLREKRVTLYTSVPVLFRLLTKALGKNGTLPDIRLVRLSGDRILASDIDAFKKHFAATCLLRAAYGSSECNLATCYFIDQAYDSTRKGVPAGYALPGVELFIVDGEQNRLGPGEQGEIVARSRYLAEGYWRNPKRSDERFSIDNRRPDEEALLDARPRLPRAGRLSDSPRPHRLSL